jgi:branched-chain amino acid transport system substrate-binding protein
VTLRSYLAPTALCLLLAAAAARAADRLEIAYMDPLSGAFALQGQTNLHHAQAAADAIDARGGVLSGTRIEVVPFDDKLSPQEAVLAFKAAVDRGIRFLFMTTGSNVAGALSEAVARHNERDPEHTVLLLNTGAIDPALTNERCNFWHFRFDLTTDMKIDALTGYMARQPGIRQVYLLNQDYAFGQSVSRAGKEMLARKRPDVKIVGDDLHPVGKVKDFAPYVGKIKASGADAVLTGNFGTDLFLLVRAAREAGLHVDFYTTYGYTPGVPASMGAFGADHVKVVHAWHDNVAGNRLEQFAADYRKRYAEDYSHHPIKIGFDMLARALDQAKSTDPLKVALALEGMRFQGDTGEVVMRAEDHQAAIPTYISTFTKTGGAVKHDAEGTGFGWRTEARLEAKDVVLPTTCRMTRP